MTDPKPEQDEAPKKPRIRRVTVGRLIALARTQAGRIGLGLVFLAFASTAALGFPLAIRFLIDQAIDSNGVIDTVAVDTWCLRLMGFFVLQGAAGGLRYYLFTTAGERIVANLRETLFRAILRQEIGFFDARRTGELTSRLSADTGIIQSTVSVNVSMWMRNMVSVIGGVGLLFWTSPKLTLLMLSVVPPVALGAVFYGRRVRKLSKDVQQAIADSSEVAEETIAGMRTVRAFAGERAEAARYEGRIEASYSLARQRTALASLVMAVGSFAGFAAATAVLWYGVRLVGTHELTSGELASFLLYTFIIAGALAALSELWADLMRAMGATERVFELIDRVPSIAPSGGEILPTVTGHVQFERVKFHYPTRPDIQVLDGLDLEMKPGEVIALVGPSGAGKSTIAGLLGRLYDPSGGRVLLDGHDLKTLDPEWLHRHVGVVAQEPILFSSSIAENIRYGKPEASDAEVEAAARAANAHDFVSAFPEGYRTKVGERGVQLSGGQKQRVAIARALLADPPLLVLDEATSALDAESEHLVKEALERLMRGRTTLVIAHRLSTVRGADRVLVLEGGKVVQSGDHHALMGEDGLYRRLVERQLVAA